MGGGWSSPLVCRLPPPLLAVWMEGTERARRFPCSHLERCCSTLMTASFSSRRA